MSSRFLKCTNVTTTHTTSTSFVTLNSLASSIYDLFKSGGSYDIGADNAHVQWNNGVFEVVIEDSVLPSAATDLATLKSNVRTGLLTLSAITALSVDDITLLDMSSVIQPAMGAYAPDYTASGAPGVNHDGIDTAGVGRNFSVGSIWVQTDGTVWICRSAATGAAVWVSPQAYTPGTTGDWASSNPTTFAAALDRLADRMKPGLAYAAPATLPGTPLLIYLPDKGFSGRAFEAMGAVTDQSATPLTISQATHANKPRFQPAWGSTRAHSLHTSAHWLSVGTALGKPANWTIFAVFMTESNADMEICGSVDSGGNPYNAWGNLEINYGSTGELGYSFGNGNIGGNSYGVTTNAGLTSFRWYVVCVDYISGNNAPDIYVDGGTARSLTKQATSATTCAGTAQNYSIGRFGDYASLSANARIGAIVVYGGGSALSSGNRASATTILKNWFGIA